MSAHATNATLSDYQWQYRLIAVFATTPVEFEEARVALRGAGGSDARDIAWFVVHDDAVASNLPNPPAAAEFRQLHSDSGFGAVLVGKDGTVKARQAGRLDIAAFKAQIDQMPMRQQQMRTEGDPD